MKEIHDIHHRNVLRKRSSVDLWSDPLVNAWAGEVFSCHPTIDKVIIADLCDWLRRTVNPASLDSARDMATAALCSVLLRREGNTAESNKIATAVAQAVTEFRQREKAVQSRFSVFNSPECVFATSLCFRDFTEEEPRAILVDRIKHSLTSGAEARPTRLVLFTAAAFEMGELEMLKTTCVRFASTLDIARLDRSDFLFTFWFFERYAQVLKTVLGNAAQVGHIREQLRERMQEWWNYEGISLSTGDDNGLSQLEAIVLDEALIRASEAQIFDPGKMFDSRRLHDAIVESSRSLFVSGHYAPAIFEAFKRVNNEVKQVSGLSDKDGRDLMALAFNKSRPVIRLNPLQNQSDHDEQEGFKFLFMGSMQGIRNPKAHEAIIQNDRYKTLEYLGIASLLLRRLDEREAP